MALRVAIGPTSFAQADDAPMRKLRAAGCEVVDNPHKRRLTEEEAIRHLEGVDGLIAGLEPLNRRVIEASPQLKAIARVGIGVTNVDFEAAEEHGVKVSSTPDGPIGAVAEMTLAALLALSRNLLPMNADLHNGKWEKRIGTGLDGAAVLFIGYGRIGRRAAAYMRALGALILVYDPYIDASGLDAGDEWVSELHDGLGRADVVTLHAAGIDCVLDGAAFNAMKNEVILLNSARGELVDESALVEALESGKVRGAWFDAFWKEPYEGPLTDFDQVLLTPHVGTSTRACRLDMETTAVDNLLRDLGVTEGA